MLIAITGCIGSGKSYILKLISQNFAYKTFSCDEFVNDAYHNAIVKEKLNEMFHCIEKDVVNKQILKQQLNEDNLNILNEIIHPYVIDKIKEINSKFPSELVFVEVPLLFEINIKYLFDYTISIDIDDELRHNRLRQRNSKQYNYMLFLESKQLTNEQKKTLADFTIKSTYDEKDNLLQLQRIIAKIKGV